MSKQTRNRQARQKRAVATGSVREEKRAMVPETPWLSFGLPLLLAAMAFCVYLPSIRSDFVYDGPGEIKEGFITSLSNLPAVLSLKVLGMPLVLADRPGTILYLMLNAALWGTSPWGYHLANNLLHAANVGLLVVLLRRLMFEGGVDMAPAAGTKIRVAMAIPVLIFALHPMAVEPVSAINYSSDLLVAFFTLLGLLAATAFRSGREGNAVPVGTAGVLCCLAAVMCKESGLVVALLLAVYWFLFRRTDVKAPWLVFMGSALAVTVIFLAARFSLAVPDGIKAPKYLGGSLMQVFLIQPRIWVFMLGKLLWPVRLSADYTLEDVGIVSTPLAFFVLALFLFLQSWLAVKSRIGALGMAVFWLGLATVSNFVPLHRINGDRFYYLPLAGLSLQLAALLFMMMKARANFWLAGAPLFLALIPLTWLTFERQQVFANDLSLWRNTVQVSPFSWTAHIILGVNLEQMNHLDEAKVEFEKSIQIDPGVPEAHGFLGLLLTHEGKEAEAIAEFEKEVRLDPQLAEGYNNLGNAYFHVSQFDLAIAQYQTALQLDPRLTQAVYNLGNAYFKEGKSDLAMAQYQRAVEIDPQLGQAYQNMGTILLRQGQLDAAITHYEKAAEVAPEDPEVQRNLNNALAEKQKQQGLADQLRSLISQPH